MHVHPRDFRGETGMPYHGDPRSFWRVSCDRNAFEGRRAVLEWCAASWCYSAASTARFFCDMLEEVMLVKQLSG